MREKMFATHPPKDSDVKYARGGVVDVEFIVQYLILAYANKLPQLLDNYGNIALLHIAADAGLISHTPRRPSPHRLPLLPPATTQHPPARCR